MNLKNLKLNFTKKHIIGFVLVFAVLAGGALMYKIFLTKGANYSWLQTDWSGGASTTAIASHVTDQTGWTKYYSKDTLLSTTTDGQLTLDATTATTTDTTTADFNSVSASSSVYTLSDSVYLKKPNGLACTSATECVAGYCLGSICKDLAVGDTYQGGKIFYVSGEHGLIAMTSDTSANAQWGCYGTTISGADSTTDGAQNTIDIVNGCAEASRAARLCSDLSSGGYSDWYLPAKDQLHTLYGQRAVVGGFTSDYYWSSTEVSSNNAWLEYFFNGNQYSGNKGFGHYVRCIRSFQLLNGNQE